MNSHGMQSASLYNYASITCSVCALISHLKSMTRVHRGPFKAASQDHCPCRFFSPSYLERTSKASLILHRASRFEMLGREGEQGALRANCKQTRTHKYACQHIAVAVQTTPSVLVDLVSVLRCSRQAPRRLPAAGCVLFVRTSKTLKGSNAV